jgi:hypothetical protein
MKIFLFCRLAQNKAGGFVQDNNSEKIFEDP